MRFVVIENSREWTEPARRVAETDTAAILAEDVEAEAQRRLRACQAFGVPLLALRGISDGADELGHVDDWLQYLHVIDEKLAAAIDLIEAAYPA